MVQRREQNPADGVAQGYDKNANNRSDAPCAGYPEVKHIRHAVFCTAEDENHDAEKQRQVLAEFMRIAAVSVYGDVDQDITEHTQDEQTDQAVTQLDSTHGCGLLTESGRAARQEHETGCNPGSDEVPQPNDRQVESIAAVILKNIANLAGEEMKAKSADDEKPDRKKSGSDDAVLYREKDKRAESDAHSGQDPGEKDFCTIFHSEASAASRICLQSTAAVTEPTPPGTGEIARTFGSTAANCTSPQIPPSDAALTPISTTT